MAEKINVTLIAGATASGKSAYAMSLAKTSGAVIINADSMQVYTELRILTARPSIEDEAEVEHRLYGYIPASHAFSVGQWVRDATAAIEDVVGSGRPAIVVGGTGLYFKALLEGLSPIPEISDAVRAHWRAEAQRCGAGELHTILIERDPLAAAALRPSDTQRVVRALEVFDTTGRSIVYWQQQPSLSPLKSLSQRTEIHKLFVHRDREDIYRRCDQRLTKMVDEGALDEVEVLRALHLDPGLPAMRALGVQPLIEYLDGEPTKARLADAVAQAQMTTRRYVKRQLTWARSNMSAWNNILTK